MKIQALILLFPFTFFLAETVSFPSQVNSKCKKMSCTKMMKPMKCSGKNDSKQRSSGKCNSTPDCTICPVCSVFTSQQQYEPTSNSLAIKKKYQQKSTGFVTSYIPPVWKPPDTGFLSS
jgi:hypothetical protein